MCEKQKLLIVDDENINIEFLVQQLSTDFEIKVAFNGSQALSVMQNYPIDLAILDVHLSNGMTGFDIARKLQENSQNGLVPFVFLSSDANDETITKGFEVGALDFLLKPLDPHIFKKKFQIYKKFVSKNIENNTNISLLEQYKQTIDHSSIVSKTNKNGIITYVNDKFCKISGHTQDELIGYSQNIVRHPDSDPTLFEYLWYTIKELKTPWTGEIQNKKKDGSSYWVQATISPILDNDGNIIEYIGIRTDITDQHKIQNYFENQLNISTKELDLALNLTKQYEEAVDKKIAILRTDTNNRITFVNDNFCKVSGYSFEELIGKDCSSLRDISHIDSKDCERLKKSLEQDRVSKILFKNISKNNKPFYMDTIKDVDGNIVEHLHLMTDITEIIELSDEIVDTQKEIVFTMGAIGETRSKETGLHVKRVAEYSYTLAKLYGLDEAHATLIKQASPMHDIGKVGIPDHILNKPGKLTPEEFEEIKHHAQLGYEMLKHSNRPILNTAATIAYTHHEKWNGLGYPNGLKGEEIPIEGRITSIADVFDALGHDRVYKKAWPLDDILNLLLRGKGESFDPELVDLFIENLETILSIKKRFEDEDINL